MDPATLAQQLQSMQLAYLQLISGGKTQSASYTQADGSRSITYTQGNIGALVQGILLVQKQLAALNGSCCNIRPPITPFF
ncbi:gpW family protein [Paraburkholderia sp. HD33-4]|uniref:gpW family protein n=1 Tax=Paraburkholderia sp. HD33-4 TaxID=2883242 RepID=UPI001F226477|nr:gpW family protein [Paraburkholderia sp. HD33-4]